MTSPTLISQTAQTPAPLLTPARAASMARFRTPVLLFCVTMLSTTSVGMRYMHNFNLGLAPLTSDTDILPFVWVFQHLSGIAAGLPFSITLVAILLAHEFGHYFACKAFKVDATLPYLLPSPSISGSFGAVIRLKSRVRTRSALIVIGALGPIAGFLVALITVPLGLAFSHYSAIGHPIAERVQSPLLIAGFHSLIAHWTGTFHDPAQSIQLLVPHPILIASWMGILITALNLIPAGQLDGGHILYAISPAAHKISSRLVVVALFLLGIFSFAGWIVWAFILLMPSMRHPMIPDDNPVKPWQWALVPLCAIILILAFTYQPLVGKSLISVFGNVQARHY